MTTVTQHGLGYLSVAYEPRASEEWGSSSREARWHLQVPLDLPHVGRVQTALLVAGYTYRIECVDGRWTWNGSPMLSDRLPMQDGRELILDPFRKYDIRKNDGWYIEEVDGA